MPSRNRSVCNALIVTVIVAAGQLSQAQTKAGPAEIYPDPKMTPGKTNPDITQDNLKSTVCSEKWTGINKFTHKEATGTEILRPPVEITDKIKTQTMKAYHSTGAADQYELDHFISLELGGCPDCVENLWPQAYGDAKHPMTMPQRATFDKANPNDKTILPGSSQKDKVEDHLKTEICTGAVTLDRAQKIVTGDWYACYLNITASPKRDCK